MAEKRKTHGAMTIHQIFEIDAKIGDLYKNGEPGVVAERSVGTAIAKLMARRMANDGKAHIGDGAHVQQLMQCGIAKTTAKRIVKKARDIATDMPPMPDPEIQPQTPEKSRTISPKAKAGDNIAVPLITESSQVERLKGDPRESDGFVWDPKAGGQGDYVDPQSLISGFIRVRDGDVWDARHGKFLKRSTLQDGYKREEDDWIWNSTMGMYRNPDPKATNPYGLPDG